MGRVASYATFTLFYIEKMDQDSIPHTLRTFDLALNVPLHASVTDKLEISVSKRQTVIYLAEIAVIHWEASRAYDNTTTWHF